MRSAAPRPAASPIALLTIAFVTFATLAGLSAATANAKPSPMKPRVVVGPNRAIDSLNGLSIAPDGSGGLVLLKTVAGVPHVFVSRLEQGAWLSPEQVDVGLSAASSQPQIAADDHGELVVAFVNAGAVYVSTVRNQNQAFSTPAPIATGAADPSISLNGYGVGYLAYTAQDGAGYDVDVNYFDGKAWYPASPHFVNVTEADDAGTGAGVPDVVAAGDGVGIVTWGENGHIYTRRVWGTATSVQSQQVDAATVDGWTEVTADSPRISVGGDSSFPVAVFREEVTSAGKLQSRVLATRLVAETNWLPAPVDGLAAGPQNATQPQVAFGVAGAGFLTTATGSGNRLVATPVGLDGYLSQQPAPLAPGGGVALPDAVPASAGRATVIAWQRTPKKGRPRILLSWARPGPHGGKAFRPVRISAAGRGPTDAALGLFAGGDQSGDAVAAWVQGRAGARSIDAAELLSSPGATAGPQLVAYTRYSTPTLHWPAASESWGPLRYTVRVDGSVVGRTNQLEWKLRRPLKDGRHAWWLTSINEASKSTIGSPETLFVDTHPPTLHVHLSGGRKAGETLKLTLRYADLPNPSEPGETWSSGVAFATVNWGGRAVRVGRATGSRIFRHVHNHRLDYTVTVKHVYPSGGHHTVTASVTDHAGNTTTVTRKLAIQAVRKGKR